MERYCFYVGLEFDQNKQPIRECPTLVARAQKKAAMRFGGFSATSQVGGWIDGKGELVVEKSMKLEILVEGGEGMQDFALYLRAAFNQAQVIMTVEDLNRRGDNKIQ